MVRRLVTDRAWMSPSPPPAHRTGLYIARAWAAWWIAFALATGLGGGFVSIGETALQTALMALFTGGSVFIATRWRRQGAWLLVLEGLVLTLGYPLVMNPQFPIVTIVFVIVTLGLPPLVAGVMLLSPSSQGYPPQP